MKIPREHGLYVVLASCWLIGALYTGEPRWTPALVILSVAVSAVLLQGVARDWVRGGRARRSRSIPPGDILVIGLLLLVLCAGSVHLVTISWPVSIPGLLAAICGGLYLRGVARRETMISQSVAGFLGVTFLTPATYLVTAQEIVPLQGALLWGTTAAYFCSSIFTVRLRLDGNGAVRPAVAYHTIATIVVLGPVLAGISPLSFLLPVFVSWLRLCSILWNLQWWMRRPLREIGIIETVAAVIVVSLIVFVS